MIKQSEYCSTRWKYTASSLVAVAGGWRVPCVRVVALLLVVLMCRSSSFGYSVLTHEEIVDLLWSDEIRPLLLKRYPQMSEDQLKEAHAYAYGGAVIQDLGYYPSGSAEFSDLVHYVRSGDFVRELLLESQDANEYAFPAQAQAPAQALAPVVSAGKHFDRVLIIVLENQNYGSAMKDPFLAQLAKMGASFSDFRALIHPSYPNYLAMVAGSSFGVQSNDQITLPDDSSHRTIADFLDWKNYAEDYPSEPRPFLGDRGHYARKHVPFLSFAKIQQESFGNVISVYPKDPHNRFTADVEDFRSDPKKHPLPRYMFYSPNLDDDGHDPVLLPGRGLRKASSWLSTFLKDWFPLDETTKGTLVIVTFDESEFAEKTNRIYTVFLGDMVKPGEITRTYTHYSVLRTIEDNFGLPPLNSGDGNAAPISEVWK